MKKLLALGLVAVVGLLAAVLLNPVLQRRAIRSTKARPIAMAYFKWVTPSRVDRYFSEQPIRKVQIGSGDYRMPGWLNTDIEPDMDTAYLDATARFPFPDASVDYIFSEQMIEHIPYADGIRMLTECYRVLKPGGKVRTSTPNLDAYIRLFSDHSPEAQDFIREKLKFHDWPKTTSPPTVILNLQMREWFHAFLYDMPTLREVHEKAGFRTIREYRLGESDDPVLNGIEYRVTREPQIAFFENMVVEATR